MAVGDDLPSKPATPADQFQAITRDFNAEGYALRQAQTDAEREKIVLRVEKLTQRLMEIAERNPQDPVAVDALIQAITHEIWMENNTPHAGRGEKSPEPAAIALLLRDHLRSEKLGEACRRMSYGFRKECETFIRTVLEASPHPDVQGLACLRLAQFLNARSQRLILLKDQPEMARRYAGLFGKDYLEKLRRQNHAQVAREVETLFERAKTQFSDVKMSYGGTVGEKAALELHELRHLSVGKAAQEIAGLDQDGRRFELSEYRGKVVLLYFWSEY